MLSKDNLLATLNKHLFQHLILAFASAGLLANSKSVSSDLWKTGPGEVVLVTDSFGLCLFFITISKMLLIHVTAAATDETSRIIIRRTGVTTGWRKRNIQFN